MFVNPNFLTSYVMKKVTKIHHQEVLRMRLKYPFIRAKPACILTLIVVETPAKKVFIQKTAPPYSFSMLKLTHLLIRLFHFN